jgi:isopenicillin N synthase-like dioxygenase
MAGSAAMPVIDAGPLIGPASAAARAEVAGEIQAACRDRGFFYLTGHGVPTGLLRAFTGTYGDYLLGKVSKVFPQLRRDVLE